MLYNIINFINRTYAFDNFVYFIANTRYWISKTALNDFGLNIEQRNPCLLFVLRLNELSVYVQLYVYIYSGHSSSPFRVENIFEMKCMHIQIPYTEPENFRLNC